MIKKSFLLLLPFIIAFFIFSTFGYSIHSYYKTTYLHQSFFLYFFEEIDQQYCYEKIILPKQSFSKNLVSKIIEKQLLGSKNYFTANNNDDNVYLKNIQFLKIYFNH